MKTACTRVVLFAVLMAGSIAGLQAQQDPQYSQYVFNKLAYNPAYAGSEDMLSTTLLLRNQWVDFDGHPLTQVLSGHMPMDFVLPNAGAGIHIVNDMLGAERSTQFTLSFSYRFDLDFGKIYIGLNAGGIQDALDGSQLVAVDPDDPIVPTTLVSGFAPDFGMGVYFKRNDLEVGLSTTHLLETSTKYDINGNTVTIPYIRNYYIIGSYKYHIENSDFDIKPTILIKTDATRTPQIDLNAMVIYNDHVWGGLAIRGFDKLNRDGLIAMVGMDVTDRFSVGYSYDVTLSALKKASSGSHEFMLNYKLPIKMPSKPLKTIYTPRFL